MPAGNSPVTHLNNPSVWIAAVSAVFVALAFLWSVKKDVAARKADDARKRRERDRQSEIRGYFKRHYEVHDRCLGLIDNALSLLPSNQAAIRRLLNTCGSVIERTTEDETVINRDGSDDE